MTYMLNQTGAVGAGRALHSRAFGRIRRVALAALVTPALFVSGTAITLADRGPPPDSDLSAGCAAINEDFGASPYLSISSHDDGWRYEGDYLLNTRDYTYLMLAAGEQITFAYTVVGGSEEDNFAEIWFVQGAMDWVHNDTSMGEGLITGGGTHVISEDGASFFFSLMAVLTSEGGSFTEAVVTITCSAPEGDPDPDPDSDPESDTADVERQVQGFVESRQGHLAANVRVPSLEDRRQQQTDAPPVVLEFMPSSGHVAANAAASLAQLDPDYSTPFNIWFDGTLALHNRPQNDGHWGRFGILNFGADYLVTNELLVGLSVHIDQMTDPSNTAVVSGTGWLVGPYVSTEVLPGVFWDANFVYGQSTNTVDSPGWTGTFGTTRKLFETSIKGTVALDETTTLTPRLAMFYISEDVGAYTLSDGKGGTVNVAGYTEEQLRASLGLELSRAIALDNGLTLTPTLGLSGGYAALGGPGAFGKVTAGIALETESGFEITTGLSSTLDAQGAKSIGANAGISGAF